MHFQLEILERLVYSPDLAPSDYRLILALKEQLNSKRLHSDNNMQTCVIQCCQLQETDFDQGSKKYFCDVTIGSFIEKYSVGHKTVHVMFLLVLEINTLEYMTSKLIIIACPLHLVFLSCLQQLYKITSMIK